MGFVGILLGLSLLIWFAYKGWSVLLLAPAAALIAAAAAGQPLLAHWTQTFMGSARYVKCVPERGRIGIFNRSYYEEVLVVRVHREISSSTMSPGTSCSAGIMRVSPLRSVRASAESMLRIDSSAFSALLS
jgi:hypothetical protein